MEEAGIPRLCLLDTILPNGDNQKMSPDPASVPWLRPGWNFRNLE